MFVKNLVVLCLAAAAMAISPAARADDLRNIKRGEPVPAFKLPTIDATVVDSEAMKGSVVVVVCLSANQRRSELAAMESAQVVHDMADPKVHLVHATADVVQKADFEKLRTDRAITVPLAFDGDRAWFAKLGLIVFPTTIVINPEGRLASVISLHGADYKRTLDAYIRHALGQWTDEQLKQALEVRASDEASPRSQASAHRALARSLRDKGRLDAAKSELNKAREFDPENREIMLDYAELDIVTGDLDGAGTLVDLVLTMQPDHRRAKQVKGIVLFRQGKLDEALRALEAALDLNPSPEQAHFYLGQIYEARGDPAKAMEHYRDGLRHALHEPAVAPTPPGK